MEPSSETVKAASNDTHQPSVEPSPKTPEVELQKEQQPQVEASNQRNINNTIQDIISNIDSNIKEQEGIALLKQQELQLIKKQQDLAKQIQEQQLLVQQLTAENQLQKQQLQQQQEIQLQQQRYQQPQQQLSPSYQPQELVSKLSTYEEKQDDSSYSCKTESYESKVRESTNVPRKIDLHKIFTPATDAPEILPKNRKLYASSAFYSPTLHPTVEDQVELARRISHSLSDISNQKSKGQSMYVNRKKRSVKWVHEGSGQANIDESQEYQEGWKENNDLSIIDVKRPIEKLPLRLVMNPCGQIRDYSSLRESLNTETGLLSPNNCAELITALKLQKGRGAELFAKRRRKSEKWVVDETNAGIQSPCGLSDQQYQQKPLTSPSVLNAYSLVGKHRVQLNMQQEQLIEKYAKPGLKLTKTPWEAALETGSASTAFVEEAKTRSHTPTPSVLLSLAPTPQYYDKHRRSVTTYGVIVPDSVGTTINAHQYGRDHAFVQQDLGDRNTADKPSPIKPHRDLAYKPSIPQGWKAPNVELPRALYVPKEIPLESYTTPPVTTSIKRSHEIFSPSGLSVSNTNSGSLHQISYSTSINNQPYYGSSPQSIGFPHAKPQNDGGFPTGANQVSLPKQMLYSPTSYQTVPQNTILVVPQVNFNPSPLPYEKLSKFENSDPALNSPKTLYTPQQPQLNVRGTSKMRNTSTSPFGSGINVRSGYSPRPDNYCITSPISSLGSPRPPFFNGESPYGQSYNTSARAWKSTGRGTVGIEINGLFKRCSGPTALHISAGNLPYTDF